jgi:hypothetical protein
VAAKFEFKTRSTIPTKSPFYRIQATCPDAQLLLVSQGFSTEYTQAKPLRDPKVLVKGHVDVIFTEKRHIARLINTQIGAKKPLTLLPAVEKALSRAKEATLRMECGADWVQKEGQ